MTSHPLVIATDSRYLVKTSFHLTGLQTSLVFARTVALVVWVAESSRQGVTMSQNRLLSFSPVRALIASWSAIMSLACMGTSIAHAIVMMPMTFKETLHDSGGVFVGKLIKAEFRWSGPDKGTPTTDYTFLVQEVLKGDDAIKKDKSLTLTFWGGTTEVGTYKILGSPPAPEVGQRYLLMLRSDWTKTQQATPLVGVYHGLIRIAEDELLDAYGTPLYISGGEVKRASEIGAGGDNDNRVTLKDAAVAISHQLRDLKNDKPRRRPWRKADGEADEPIDEQSSKPLPPIGTDIRPVDKPEPPTDMRGIKGDGLAIVNEFGVVPTSFSSISILFNPLPLNSPYTPVDQYQMTAWNFYRPGDPAVNHPPSSINALFALLDRQEWHHNNGKSDVAGPVGNAKLVAEHLPVWDDLEVAATFSLVVPFTGLTGKIIESDICFNPSYTFTLDSESIVNGAEDRIPLYYTLLHELGHSAGLEHDFFSLGVMNYGPVKYWALIGGPCAEDRRQLKKFYSGPFASKNELAVYLFHTNGFENYEDAPIPSTVRRGDTITVSKYHVENINARDPIPEPQLYWYLCKERNFNSYFPLGVTLYPRLEPLAHFDPNSVSRVLTVPSSVPPGNYYLGVATPGEASGSNVYPFGTDRAFSVSRIQVTAAE